MRLHLITFRLSFPKELKTEDVLQGLLTIAGASRTTALPLRFSARGTSRKVEHFLAVPSSHRRLIKQLESQIPGLKAEAVETDAAPLPFVWKLWQSSSRRPLRTDRPALTTRALLISLLGTRQHEALELHWLLGPVRRPLGVGTKHTAMLGESWPRALLSAAFVPPGDLDSDARRALRDKLKEPAWRIDGQIAVQAVDRQRAQELASALMSSLRTSEGPGVQLGVRRSSPKQLTRTPWRWPLQINAVEFTGMLAWPLDDAGKGLPVQVERHRRLESTTDPRGGRLLGSTPSGRDLRLEGNDSLKHLHVMGPSGSGKSTLLLNLILQDIEAGRSVVVLDPKGDLVEDVLRRYPLKRLADLVVLDPTDQAPIGMNPLHKPAQPELVADQLLGIFARMFSDTFGPRTQDVLHASLLTLARWGEGSLAVLPLLLTNPTLRRKIVAASPDPLGTAPFWAWFERISDAERQQVIAPTLNKVRPFLLRPDLRSVIGQVEPRFELREVLTKRRVVLVSLPKGTLGPEGSALLGTVLLNQLWQLIQSRSAIPAERRHRVCVYLDEFQDFLRLPADVGDLLVQARGLGAAFTLAHQHLGQLPPEIKSAVLSNARSRVLFQLAADDARVMANGHPEIKAEDLTSLPPYEAYASLLTGNEVQPYVSLLTKPATEQSTTSSTMRAASRDRFGVPRTETEQALRKLAGSQNDSDGPIGRRPRGQS